jgi:hypothetical protein
MPLSSVPESGRPERTCPFEESVSLSGLGVSVLSHLDLEGMLEFLQELLALEARRNHLTHGPLFRACGTPFPLSVGVVRGGDWPSSVPDWIQVEGRYWLVPGASTEEAQAAFAAALADAARVEDLEKAMKALAVRVVRFCGRRANG